jgi:hypothetical protein
MAEHPGLISRRGLLIGAGAAAALGRLGPGVMVGSAAAATPSTTLGGLPVARLAMHVHGSWSEGQLSWAQACESAIAEGLDVLYFTDHNFRARALNYMTKLDGAWVPSTTGSCAAHTGTLASTGVMRLMAKAAYNSTATQLMTIEQSSNAFNRLRTGIGGQSMTVKFGNVVMGTKTSFEIVVSLSLHPATGGRPAGQYSLRYRFVPGATTTARWTTSGGLVGYVRLPSIKSGSSVTLTPETDIKAIWPDIHPKDNGFYSLAFVAMTAPVKGSLIDVTLRSVQFSRPQNDAASIISNEKSILTAYATKYSTLLTILSEEVSQGPESIPHCNVFGAPPKFDNMAGITAANYPAYYSAYIAAAQAVTAANTRGFVTWNHPYGFNASATCADPVASRRNLFTTQFNNPVAPFLGAMGLEVGYGARGGMPFRGHLDLWDTFTRNGVWLTGTGASDEHNRTYWPGLGNGFITVVFPTQKSDQAITACLRRGNAFTVHPGKWPGAVLSMQVDNVPMGGVLIGSPRTRNVVISTERVPTGCRLQLLASPVDFKGVDPATTLVKEWTASQCGTGGTGTVSASVSQSGPAFYRAQVVQSDGTPIASGNPCTFLTGTPSRGVPAERLVAA